MMFAKKVNRNLFFILGTMLIMMACSLFSGQDTKPAPDLTPTPSQT